MSKSPLRLVALSLYKALLIQANHLFDANARLYVSQRIEARFRDNMRESGAKRLSELFRQARKRLTFLKKANLGDVKAVNAILAHTYGRTGKRRHELLKPFYKESAPPTEPLIPGYPRTAPPAIPAPIKALLENDLRIKQKFVVDNPPGYREISKRRLVNQMWKFYSLQKKNLKAPLPQDEIDQIKALADRYIAASPKTPFQMKLEAELKERRLQTGKYLGRYNRISPRFMRRRYQTILSGHIPAISEIEGKWIVTTTRVHKAPHLPVVGRQHMGGYKLPDGTMGGEVDQNGVRSRSR